MYSEVLTHVCQFSHICCLLTQQSANSFSTIWWVAGSGHVRLDLTRVRSMVISEEHSAPLASFLSLCTKATVQVWLVLCQAITIMVHGMHCQISPLNILPFCGTAFHAIFTVTPNLGALTKKCRKSLPLLLIKLLDERTISALQYVNTEQSVRQKCTVANIIVRFVHCGWTPSHNHNNMNQFRDNC